MTSPRGYFVTGTDTGVGKTTVSAGILASLRRRGIAVAALKPAETGCAPHPADGELLREACGTPLLLDDIVPHRYRTPVAPAVAARREGVPFSIDRVHAVLGRLLATEPSLFLVEGAGGLLVPFGDDLLAADLVSRLRLPLLVVARASLGTINHTLLTLAEARRRDLRVAGVVLSRVLAERHPDEDDNAVEIERLGQVRVLGTVGHIPVTLRRDPAALADAVDATFDPIALL